MDILELGVTVEQYKSWSRLRQIFAINVCNRTDYIEDQYIPAVAEVANEKLAEFVRTRDSNDISEQDINTFVGDIADETVRNLVGIQLKAARKFSFER